MNEINPASPVMPVYELSFWNGWYSKTSYKHGVYDSFEELDNACARFQKMKFAREDEELPAEFIPPAPRVPRSDAGARRLAEVF